ncbi:MAG: ankyrin repeat domain-containing protein [Streptomyces sp.]|uniref:ankyrin repeat domain-containing protein n=1 Tax=Streptomyces sp. TaxID=1931 RepID=UPI003D6A55E1
MRRNDQHGTDRLGRIPLHYAVLEGDAVLVRELLAAGSDPNRKDRDGFTPLHLAAQGWQPEAAAVLIEAGAEIDPVNKFGNTPLFVAVFNSRRRGELIELLRSHGSDPESSNISEQNPVGSARKISNYDVAQYFDDVN